MKKLFKKAISILLVAVMVFGAAPLAGFVGLELPEINLFTTKASAATSGTCGDNLTWNLYSNGELVISGTGAMADYTFSCDYIGNYVTTAPWERSISSIKSVTISDGVTSIGDYAFYDCDGLTSITIPDSVTSIGYIAFYNCTKLENVYYTGDIAGWCAINLESSESNPMRYADNLYINGVLIEDNLVIPDGVTSIGDRAFYDCDGLTSVTIPDSVTSIGDCAFDNCDGLTSVTIPDGVTSIGDYAFYNCSGLTSVTIPESVTSIGDLAFYGTAFYEDSSNWENDVLYIGKYLIIAKSSVSGEHQIKDGTKVIADEAFYYCDNLTSITIPESVTGIGYRAFDDCNKLATTYYVGTPEQWKNITIGAYNDNLTENIVYECNSERPYCASGVCGENLRWKLYPDGELVISGTGAMADWERYSFAPWYDCRSSIKSVTISDGVTSIGDYAFYYCDSLTSVTISDSVTSIGDLVFYWCYNLTGITIPDSVTSIGGVVFCGTAFYEDSSNWENDVLYIGKYLIDAKSSVSGEHQIKDGTKVIAEEAFYYCDNLTSITIPESVTGIGYRAFDYCNKLATTYYVGTPEQWKNIKIGAYNDNLTENIVYECNSERPYCASGVCGENLSWKLYTDGELVISGTGAMTDWTDYPYAPWYKYRSSMKSVTISDGVTSIGDYAFYYSDLTSITIPGSVTSIGDNTFYSCTKLENVYYTGDIVGWCAINLESSESNPMRYADNLYINGVLIEDNLVIPDGVTSIGDSAFYNCSSLTSVTIPESVTSIGDYVFYDCDGLTSIIYLGTPAQWSKVSIGSGNSVLAGKLVFNDDSDLTWVNWGKCGENLTWNLYSNGELVISGTGAMADWSPWYSSTQAPWDSYGSSITSVIIYDGVTSIGDYAFYNCSGLTSITIPESVTSIGGSVFNYNKNLTDVYYTGDLAAWCKIVFGDSSSDHPMYYGENLYINGKLLEGDIVIPDSVTSIGDYAFYDCDGLTSVTIPESVTSIGDSAFYNCSGLASVTIPESVTSIGDSAFYNCSSLTSVTIPESVTSIGDYAFYNCGSLVEAYYKGTLEQWVSISGASDNAGLTGRLIYECDSDKPYYGGICGDNLTWKKYLDSTELIISGTGEMNHYGEETQNAISIYGGPWHRHASSIKSVTISDGVTSIGNFAFYDCENLIKVTIGNSVTSIGMGAFYSCPNLKTATIPDGVTTIGKRAFRGCTSLAVIAIPDSVTTIGSYAFDGCRSAEKITIGKGVTSIGSSAFSGCSGVKSITVDAANTAYVSDKNGVLFDKNKTVLLLYPMGSSTKSYTIPNGVKTISSGAFEGTTDSTINTYDLNYITIPDSVTTIENRAFYCCRSLALLDIPDSVTTIGDYAFFGCTRLSEIKIGRGAETIGEYAFAGCLLLVNVIIKEGITTLEPEMFYLCVALKNVSIPRSVDLIKASTFDDCNNIKNVYYAGSKSEWEQVVVGGDNGSFSAARLHYNSIGSSIIGGSTDDPDNTPDYDSAIVDTYLMPTPTETKISYGDSIVLHVDSAKIPEGGYVEWYPSNGNFSYSVSADGTTCTISPDKSGDTTFTAIVYDAQGNIISADTQTMTSKAGFFDKLIAFFKNLFGLTKTIPEAIKITY